MTQCIECFKNKCDIETCKHECHTPLEKPITEMSQVEIDRHNREAQKEKTKDFLGL